MERELVEGGRGKEERGKGGRGWRRKETESARIHDDTYACCESHSE